MLVWKFDLFQSRGRTFSYLSKMMSNYNKKGRKKEELKYAVKWHYYLSNRKHMA